MRDSDYRLMRAMRDADPQLTARVASVMVYLGRTHADGDRALAVDQYRKHVHSVPGAHRAAQAVVRLARLEGEPRLARSMSKVTRQSARRGSMSA